jgi:hypothetical protein
VLEQVTIVPRSAIKDEEEMQVVLDTFKAYAGKNYEIM